MLLCNDIIISKFLGVGLSFHDLNGRKQPCPIVGGPGAFAPAAPRLTWRCLYVIIINRMQLRTTKLRLHSYGVDRSVPSFILRPEQ